MRKGYNARMPQPAHTNRDWDEHYRSGHTPWDSGRPSAELQQLLAEFPIPRGRAIELGCGTGTNALWLASQGFEVTAVDGSELALAEARRKSAAAGPVAAHVQWIQADVQNFGRDVTPVEFLFDRGCYHCCRQVDLAGYLATHEHVTRPGSWALVLTGNPNSGMEGGPPKVTAAELTREFEPLYRIIRLREFSFEDAGGMAGPLGWSCLMQRR
jgi:SAM-dependent methyltransferase